ncbi:MAG TPA: multiprotein bridging factor aMBF1 [Methanoregula sp.]|nr:multiprotein bridging factor aMBF1 [Methanoregula sp.]
MQCEMCGETIRGTPKLVRIEGAELQVCTKCEKFGTEVQQPRRKDLIRPVSSAAPRSGASPGAVPPVRRKRDLFDYMEGDIVDDYAARIRKARMDKGLSSKDLAMQIKEREHLIKKIENSELIPEEDVRKKLEKILEIRLIDAPETESEKKVQSKLTPTLGDLTIIKKVKKQP